MPHLISLRTREPGDAQPRLIMTEWATVKDTVREALAVARAEPVLLTDPDAFDRWWSTVSFERVAGPGSVDRDARRYRRLQILGAAPGTSPNLEQGTVLCFSNLDAFVDADLAAHPSRGEAEPIVTVATCRGEMHRMAGGHDDRCICGAVRRR